MAAQTFKGYTCKDLSKHEVYAHKSAVIKDIAIRGHGHTEIDEPTYRAHIEDFEQSLMEKYGAELEMKEHQAAQELGFDLSLIHI